MGERACTAKELFLTGLCDNETDADRDVFFGVYIWNFLTTERQEANCDSVPDAGKSTRTALQRFSLELKEHVKGMCHSTNGLDGLDVGFFLHENKVLFSNRDNDVVRVLVRRLKKRLSWESSSTPMLSSPTLPSCTSQPDSQVSLAPRTTCGSRGASKKKCGFMVCCRECIPVWWGALVKDSFECFDSWFRTGHEQPYDLITYFQYLG